MATRILSMAAASEYALEPIRDGAEFTLSRGRQRGNPSPVLVVAPTAEQPLPQSLRRLEHEYSLAAELEPVWAAKPLALTRHEGRPILELRWFIRCESLELKHADPRGCAPFGSWRMKRAGP